MRRVLKCAFVLSHSVWSFWDDPCANDVDRTWMLKSTYLHVLWQVRLDESNILFGMRLPLLSFVLFFFFFFLAMWLPQCILFSPGACRKLEQSSSNKKCWLLHAPTLNLTSLLMLYSCDSLWEFWAISIAVCFWKPHREKNEYLMMCILLPVWEFYVTTLSPTVHKKCGYIRVIYECHYCRGCDLCRLYLLCIRCVPGVSCCRRFSSPLLRPRYCRRFSSPLPCPCWKCDADRALLVSFAVDSFYSVKDLESWSPVLENKIPVSRVVIFLLFFFLGDRLRVAFVCLFVCSFSSTGHRCFVFHDMWGGNRPTTSFKWHLDPPYSLSPRACGNDCSCSFMWGFADISHAAYWNLRPCCPCLSALMN